MVEWSPEQWGKEAPQATCKSLLRRGEGAAFIVTAEGARGPGLKRHLPRKRYLFIQVGLGMADGNYRGTSPTKSPPGTAITRHNAGSSLASTTRDPTAGIWEAVEIGAGTGWPS